MYVPYGSACSEPNSQTPMSPARIAAQNQRVARVGSRFVRGNRTLDSLVTTLGGIGIPGPGTSPRAAAADFRNAPACDSSITSDGTLYGGRLAVPGVPQPGWRAAVSLGGDVLGSAPAPGAGDTSDTINAPAVLSPAAAAVAANGSATNGQTSDNGALAGGQNISGAPPGETNQSDWLAGSWPFGATVAGRRAKAQRNAGTRCAPQILPMMSVFPIPLPPSTPAGPVAAASPQTPAPGPLRTSSPYVAAPPSMPQFPSTGNLCLDLALGYVLDSQVSQAMLYQCSSKGYYTLGNNRMGPLLTPAMIAWRSQPANFAALPKIPDQNVPVATPSMMAQWGMSGFGQVDSSAFVLWGAIGLGVAALWLASEYSKGRR